MRIIRLNGRVKPADDAVTGTKHQAKSHQPENRGTNTEIHQVFHQDITGVFGTGKTGFTHRKACLHEKYHCGAQKHPYGVDRRIHTIPSN